METISAGTSTTQLTDACQPIQILLARKIVGDLHNICVSNQRNPVNHAIVTSTKPEGMVQKQCSEESIIIKEISNSDFENKNFATVTTEEIIKKFRIPKGIALTPKFSNDINVGAQIPTNIITNVSTPLMSPPLTTNEDGENSSGLIEYVEEVYEDEEEIEQMHIEEMNEVNESNDFHEYQENDELEPQVEEELEESDLIEEVESSEHQDLLMSGEADNLNETINRNSSTYLPSSYQQEADSTLTSSSVPQIIQVVQPNGTIACFQLPPNTIILQSPDGALLATTSPHPSKPGQQQIVAIQDLNSQLNEILNLSVTNSTVISPLALQPPTTTTLVLSPNNTSAPLAATSRVSAPTNIVQQSTNGAAVTQNESLQKAQQQQILA